MRVTLESTDRIVELVTPQGTVPGRVWEGTTSHGVKCYAVLTRIAAHKDENLTEFERELKVCRQPSREALEAIPLRMVL